MKKFSLLLVSALLIGLSQSGARAQAKFSETQYLTEGFGQRVSSGDFNKDGLADVVLVDWAWRDWDTVWSFYLFAQGRNGLNTTPVAYTYNKQHIRGRRASGVAVADMNHDGYSDVIISFQDSIKIMFFGASGISSSKLYHCNGSIAVIRSYDVDGDGFQDIIADNQSSVTVFYGDASGGLTPKEYPTVVPENYNDDLKVGKVANDSLVSIIVLSGEYNTATTCYRIHSNRLADTLRFFNFPLRNTVDVTQGYVSVATGTHTHSFADSVLSWFNRTNVLESVYFDCAGDYAVSVRGEDHEIAVINTATGTMNRYGLWRNPSCASDNIPADHDAVTFADVNNDGRLDVVVAIQHLSILYNQTHVFDTLQKSTSKNGRIDSVCIDSSHGVITKSIDIDRNHYMVCRAHYHVVKYRKDTLKTCFKEVSVIRYCDNQLIAYTKDSTDTLFPGEVLIDSVCVSRDTVYVSRIHNQHAVNDSFQAVVDVVQDSTQHENETQPVDSKFHLNRVVMYPNPVNDILFIDVPLDFGYFVLGVYSITGAYITSMQGNALVESHISLDTSRYEKGVYFVNIRSSNPEFLWNEKIVRY